MSITHDHTYLWTSVSSGLDLTVSNLNDAIDSFRGNINPLYIYDDAEEEITEREPPCEDLGEFLLQKYNKVKYATA